MQPLRARTIIELVGKPKDFVERAFKKMRELIKQHPGLELISEDIEPVKEKPGTKDIFGGFIEVEAKFSSLQSLIAFCFEFTPTSVEIIEPEQITIKNNELTAIFNDLQAKLHEITALYRKSEFEQKIVRKNAALLLRNFLFTLLFKKKRSIEQLSKLTGLPANSLQQFLDQLIKEGKVVKENDLYTLK
ncbi:hypothetical protein DRJ19_00725 [Candidatus Woesearchaeota archaeon]|nr:MAG: hypothetical protein DRJ19_00725 [Candidatus Woesearchaeota archaeon]